MAEGKRSFIAYADWKEVFDSLPDDKAGALIKHIFAYVNDENPKSDDFIINTLFIQIRNTLKRDLSKWKANKESRSIAGRKGNIKRYNPDIYDQLHKNSITLEEAEQIAESRKTSLSDISPSLTDSERSQDLAKLAVNVSDSVSVSVNDSVSVKEDIGVENKFSPSPSKKKSIEERKSDFKNLINENKQNYAPKMLNDFWQYWTEIGVNDRKMRFEKEKTFGIGRRLATWRQKEIEYERRNNNTGRNRHEPSKTITDYGKL